MKKVVEQELETLTDEKNEVYECDDNEEFNPYVKAEELGFDLSADSFNYIDVEFKECKTLEEIDEEFDKIMKICGRDMSELEIKRYVRCADFWSLKLLAKEYISRNVAQE